MCFTNYLLIKANLEFKIRRPTDHQVSHNKHFANTVLHNDDAYG